jgi:tRNA (guanine37-N1)-methyltransferase
MVMKIEPIDLALTYCREKLISPGVSPLVILTSAKGSAFNQAKAVSWSHQECIIIICGHYEGVDERVAQHLIDVEVRIGDYVLTGGEPAAAVIADAVCRLVPGVVGNENSTRGESHGTVGELGFPQYTRPEIYQDWSVPSELLSGHHAQIATWREQNRNQEQTED